MENVFDKLIKQYAEAQGEKLIEENERLKCDPDFIYPEGLDEKCLAAIDAATVNK
jgi:hypothetical protein